MGQVRDDQISLRDLIARLIDAAKAYARAEVTLAKRVVTARAEQAAAGIALGLIALLFVQAAVTILLAALGMWIASAIGAGGGFAVAALIGLAIAGGLGWAAMRSLAKVGSDE